MGRPRKAVPSYRLHKQSGQGIVTLTDAAGNRRDVLLGPYNTPESKAEYLRVLGEWEARGRTLAQQVTGSDLTVNELILQFWTWAEQHYRHPDGQPTSELDDYRQTLRPLKALYGSTLAAEFGPLALKALRQAMTDGSWLTEKERQKRLKNNRAIAWSRGLINQRIGRIKRMFKWAASEELVPVTVSQALATVAGLKRGRSSARETDPVQPVAEAVVNQTLPRLRPQVAAMIQLQQCTGMRPGEVVIMRTCDLDMSGPVWQYRPGSDQGPSGQHKTAWRGKCRIIPIGPKAQEILRPWLRLNLQEYLFSPREAVAALRASQRRNRKSKVQPSQQNRKKRKPKKAPGERYSARSYTKAIEVACWKYGIEAWHPNQLRHAFATEVRRRYGLEAAQVLLGHSRADVTQVYAERNLTLAERAAAEIG